MVHPDSSFSDEGCFQLGNVSQAGKFQVELFSTENLVTGRSDLLNSMEVNLLVNCSLNCFQLEIPPIFPNNDKVDTTSISGSFGDYHFKAFKVVKVLRSLSFTVLQTDKFGYLPGQTVRFRILILDRLLKPSKVFEAVDHVIVKDPAGNIIFQFWDVRLSRNSFEQLDLKCFLYVDLFPTPPKVVFKDLKWSSYLLDTGCERFFQISFLKIRFISRSPCWRSSCQSL